MNQITLCGYLTKDFQTFQSENTFIARNFLAINEVYKSKDGNTTTTKESTDFIPIVLFNKKAETASTYLKKGDKFLGTGRLRTSSYIDEGGNIKYTWQVIINHFEFVSGKKEEQSTQNKELPKEMDKSLPNKESYAELKNDDESIMPF